MKSKSDYIELDNENLIAQRSARNMTKRDSRILLIFFSILFVVYFMMVLLNPLPIFIELLLLLALYLSVKLVSNWRGWVALKVFDIHCPFCHRPLYMEKINIIKSPSKKCPHCGRIALAPINQLKE
jgi:hypothetical protein